MEVKFKLEYYYLVLEEDISKISVKNKIIIKKAIEEKLQFYPEVFGKPLRRSLKNYRSLRVGDYRVIFRIEKKVVKIFLIKHRSVVYENNFVARSE